MPARQQPADPSYVDEHHQRISEFAGDYFDDEEERSAFIDTLMERRGYTRTASWSAPAPAPNQPTGPAGNGAPAPGSGKPPYFKR